MSDPKQKAEELVGKMCLNDCTDENIERAKQYSLIAVDYVLNSNPSYYDYGGDGWKIIDNTEYWQEVKEEILKL